ncbi:heme peroxidase [Schizopora paradoxa]|uniref:Heme peroxidase n=1 Tax=Schizopora paradoxa TaxID=27342 RepID=A0A0H2RZX0_9AGAM|nr:heme peroxidase [Schizopora paradoxa]
MASTLASYAGKVLVNVSEIIHRAGEAVDSDGATQKPTLLHQALEDVHQEMVRGKAFSIKDLPALSDAIKGLGKEGIDDRKMLLEKSIVLMSRLPDDSTFSDTLQKQLVDILYKDLPHPPYSFMPVAYPSYSTASYKKDAISNGNAAPYDTGSMTVPSEHAYTNGSADTEAGQGIRDRASSSPAKSVPYAFRSADGSGYSLELPNLGKAGTPYARTVPSMSFTSIQALPEAGLVFDSLLKRQPNTPGSLLPKTESDGFAPHPGGVNSLFFAFADLVIHSLFYTDHTEEGVNRTSSYVDLSPLYGNGHPLGVGYGSQDKPGPIENDALRRFDGTGRLWEDVFADARILFMPPAVCVLLVLFCRNHNYIAKRLLEINEFGSFADPSELDESKRKAQDDELYNRSRTINCGYFAQVVLGDYVGGILGLSRDGLPWRINPLAESREVDHTLSPRGQGNACSIEFNHVYRWHAALSREDTKWTEDTFEHLFKTRDFTSISPDKFVDIVRTKLRPKDGVKEWKFHDVNGQDLLRDPVTGRFNDSDLAAILVKAADAPASTFKARGIPEVLRVVEVMGIETARRWGTCSLNEFRKFMSLKPYKTFAEWNPDPSVHKVAEELYTHIDNLELHVGLQAEEAKTAQPGVGFCPGYTISRAILADAVALVRGDKFFTTEFTVHNFTKWGLDYCLFQKDDGTKGGMISRMLFQTLPQQFAPNSIYARFPMMVPSTMGMSMAKHIDGEVGRYTFKKPVYSPVVPVKSYDDVINVLKHQERFESIFEEKMKFVTGNVRPNISLVNSILNQSNDRGRYSDMCAQITGKLLEEKSRAIPGSQKRRVDIVRDVVNLVPVYLISTELLGLPIKTEETPRGLFRDQEIYEMFANLGNFVFMNNDDYLAWSLQDKASKAKEIIMDIVGNHLSTILDQGVVSKLSDSLINWYTGESNFADGFLKSVAFGLKGSSKKVMVTSLVATIAATSALYSKALAIIVDFFLDKANKHAREKLERLVVDSWDNDARIYELVQEVLRLNPPMPVVTRRAKMNVLLPDHQKILEGERVACSIIQANIDQKYFGENASQFHPDRPTAGISGLEDVGLINSTFFKATMPRVLQVIFKLRNIHTAPGAPGKLSKVKTSELDCPTVLYSDLESKLSPFPASLSVQFDA